MSNKYRVLDQRGLNFMTLTVVGWVDLFSRKKYRDLMIECLRYCQREKGLRVYCYVIMTNHIHLVVSADGRQPLSEVIGNFKSYTATTIMKDLTKNTKESRREWLLYMFGFFAIKNRRPTAHQLWTSNNHPVALFTQKVIQQKMNYIHQNPVKAGWVEMPQHYVYSSASNYLENGKGILEVEILDEFYNSI